MLQDQEEVLAWEWDLVWTLVWVAELGEGLVVELEEGMEEA